MNGLDQQQWQDLQGRLERAGDALFGYTGLRAPLPQELQASPSDAASQRTLNALVQEAATLTARQLDIVRHALAKFDDQRYGLCENCGLAIGYSRLDARPEARFCISCQTRLEGSRR